MLSPVRVAKKEWFIAGYEFNVVEFLAQEMRDWVIGGKKLLLAYPYIIT